MASNSDIRIACYLQQLKRTQETQFQDIQRLNRTLNGQRVC
jgi:hypothetical protein